MFRPFPRNQLATKAQSFPHEIEGGVQIPHPPEDSDNQIPYSQGRQRCQMPGVCQGGGGGMLKLRFDRYIRIEVLPNLRQAGIFQISTIQKPLTRPGVKLDKKMSICSSTPSTSTLA